MVLYCQIHLTKKRECGRAGNKASQPNVPKKNCQETNHQPLNGKYEQAKRTLILMTDWDKKAGNPMHQTAHKESMSI